ncbi:hypothetical protein RFI_16993 [Reticulomyxa filosa]|uniref:Uncharacterized protein n=1 Tax=Reticulomyxa filosa TaxID=46433 RepID=X6N397_RETFI|nr:hypothetical protein RFI_16993 [Reticulomyxa filosa]|eukprot:ETO20224.1 hypothetical protein RFI_16993 [Reticulomyxa filosa]
MGNYCDIYPKSEEWESKPKIVECEQWNESEHVYCEECLHEREKSQINKEIVNVEEVQAKRSIQEELQKDVSSPKRLMLYNMILIILHHWQRYIQSKQNKMPTLPHTIQSQIVYYICGKIEFRKNGTLTIEMKLRKDGQSADFDISKITPVNVKQSKSNVKHVDMETSLQRKISEEKPQFSEHEDENAYASDKDGKNEPQKSIRVTAGDGGQQDKGIVLLGMASKGQVITFTKPDAGHHQISIQPSVSYAPFGEISEFVLSPVLDKTTTEHSFFQLEGIKQDAHGYIVEDYVSQHEDVHSATAANTLNTSASANGNEGDAEKFQGTTLMGFHAHPQSPQNDTLVPNPFGVTLMGNPPAARTK